MLFNELVNNDVVGKEAPGYVVGSDKYIAVIQANFLNVNFFCATKIF